MKTTIFSVGIVALVIAFTGCAKEPLNHLTDNESRIYVTNHNDSVNFNNFKTFAISDSVAVINNNRLKEKALTPVDSGFVNAVKNQMVQRGFTLVGADQHPDVGIDIARVYNTSTGIIDYTDYGGYYDGYWDPYYWGYPGYGYYFPAYGVYQVTEGAFEVDMLDLKDAAADNKINAVWSGLVRGEGVFDPANAGSSVQTLFDQSTYIKAGQ